MKYFSKISLVAGAGLIVLIPLLVAMRLVGATGTATVSLLPDNNPVAQGSSFNVDIYEDSGSDTVNGVDAYLSYSSSLTFVSIIDSPAFGIDAQSTGGGGSVKIGRAVCPGCAPVTGNQLVATVRFTAASAGAASINFANGTIVAHAADNTAMSLTENGTTITVTSTATMSLSPATKTVSSGTSFDVGVYENSGSDGVNAVQANLTYNAGLLSFVSLTPNTAAWPVQAQNSGGGGTVTIGRGIQPSGTPLSGSQLIATVRFTGATAGTAAVAFAGGTGVVRASNSTVEPTNNSGGSYTITSVGSSGGSSTKPKSTGSSSIPKSVTTSPSVQSTPITTPVDTSGPVISNVKVTNLSLNTATINWQTSEPATSEVDYGLSTKFILSKVDRTLTKNHSLALDRKVLIAHKTYHFIVKSADATGNQSASADMTFTTGSSLSTSKLVLIGLVVGGLVLAAAGGFRALNKPGGRGGDSSGHGTYIEPKPLIVGGGSNQSQPVVKPNQKSVAAAPAAPAAPAAEEDPQTPGEIIMPKTPPK